MRKSPVISVMLLSLTLLLAFPQGYASAAPAFELKAESSEVRAGEELTLTFAARNIEDVYGYEIQLSFDPQYFRYVDAKSDLYELLFRAETDDESELILLATKAGPVDGESGEVELLEIVFEAVEETAESVIELNRVKLANSEAESDSYKPSIELRLAITEGEAPSGEDPSLPEFHDITGHWAEEQIRRAVELGMIQGYGDGTFRPNNQVTRAEFAVMLQAIKEYDTNSVDIARPADYEAIGPWAREAVLALMGEGVIAGYQDGTFRPAHTLRRSELAMMLASTLELDVTGGLKPTYRDAEQIPAWAAPSIRAASDAGLLQGRGNDMFRPNETTTRAEAVQVLLSIYDF